MYASTITKTLAAADDNGIAESQALAAAGFLTLNGALVVAGVAQLLSGRQVVIHSGGDDSTLTWTVLGTNESGSPIKDSFAGVNAGDATSNLLNFKSVTSIYANKAVATTAYAGTNGVGASDPKIFARTIGTPHLDLQAVLVSGAVNYDVQYTQEEFLQPVSTTGAQSSNANGDVTPNPVWVSFTDMTGKSAAAQGAEVITMNAWRVKINSGTGVLRVTGVQPGLGSP